MEFHPDAPEGFKVKLSLLGDTVRELKYPNRIWEAAVVFQSAEPLSPGEDLPRPD